VLHGRAWRVPAGFAFRLDDVARVIVPREFADHYALRCQTMAADKDWSKRREPKTRQFGDISGSGVWAMFANNHHSGGLVAVWIPAAPAF
jgi:hypothetical protein